MSIFDLIFRPNSKLLPEALWTVAVDDKQVSATDHVGVRKTLLFSALSAIRIETNDTGPWNTDFWWLLFGADGMLACGFPKGATGEQAAIERIICLPGFNHEEYSKAIKSTSNENFLVWMWS
jgi:hypothetical protein